LKSESPTKLYLESNKLNLENIPNEEFYSLSDINNSTINEFLKLFYEKKIGIFATDLKIPIYDEKMHLSNIIY